MDGLEKEAVKADFRLAAMHATHRIQKEIGFEDKWRALVEHTIYDLMKDAYERKRDNPILMSDEDAEIAQDPERS